MPFIHTTTLIDLLKARLENMKIDADKPESPENRLFQRVAVFGAAQLDEAFKATFAAEQRVSFIVPVGDRHPNDRGRLVLTSQRETSLVVLMADRAVNKAKAEAIVGGPNAIGILEMKDTVIDNLTTVPFSTADLCFAPGEGEPLMIQGEGKTNTGNLGRECWAQRFNVYAGEICQAIP